jgi:hypothetical protein
MGVIQNKNIKSIKIEEIKKLKELFNKEYQKRDYIGRDYSNLNCLGNIKLLSNKTIGIQGSTLSNEKSSLFTKNICKKAIQNNITIITGGAKGIDLIAIQFAVENNGNCVIVLPCGINTYIKKLKNDFLFSEKIENGNILLISLFENDDTFISYRAVHRNGLIYCLSNKMFVAQCTKNTGRDEDYGCLGSSLIFGFKLGKKVCIKGTDLEFDDRNKILIEIGGELAIKYNTNGDIVEKTEDEKNAFKNKMNEINDLSISSKIEKKFKIKFFQEELEKHYKVKFKDYIKDYIKNYIEKHYPIEEKQNSNDLLK